VNGKYSIGFILSCIFPSLFLIFFTVPRTIVVIDFLSLIFLAVGSVISISLTLLFKRIYRLELIIVAFVGFAPAIVAILLSINMFLGGAAKKLIFVLPEGKYINTVEQLYENNGITIELDNPLLTRFERFRWFGIEEIKEREPDTAIYMMGAGRLGWPIVESKVLK